MNTYTHFSANFGDNLINVYRSEKCLKQIVEENKAYIFILKCIFPSSSGFRVDYLRKSPDGSCSIARCRMLTL
jgi:ribonuclease HIII